LGFLLSYGKEQGPEIANPFRDKSDLLRLKPVKARQMNYVFQAIQKTRATLKPDLPLIGFAGAPFTMAAYLIEGGGSKNFSRAKNLMYQDAATWHALLSKITEATIVYLQGQVQAGADAIQVFDSWVGCLSPYDYETYVLPHTERLISAVKKKNAPVIYFGTGTAGLLGSFKKCQADVIGVDWRISLPEARKILGSLPVQGNLDPMVLFAPVSVVQQQAKRILDEAAEKPGFIFNLGHGILPETPLDNVLALIKTVKEFSFL
jgi:uroporphyrinogen decarboxylase